MGSFLPCCPCWACNFSSFLLRGKEKLFQSRCLQVCQFETWNWLGGWCGLKCWQLCADGGREEVLNLNWCAQTWERALSYNFSKDIVHEMMRWFCTPSLTYPNGKAKF